jgi:hypothetical protein
MSMMNSRSISIGLMVLALCVTTGTSGCSSNSNEAEYLRTTSPGTPAEPESVASRRERTKAVPKAPEKGAKNKAKSGQG